MDLPMGLGKFEEDDRVPSEDELRRTIAAIESVNRETQTIFFSIVHDSQIKVLKDVLKSYGYPYANTMVIYKQYKTDKAAQGGFVSAAVFAVVAWKDIKVNRYRIIPKSSDAITIAQWTQMSGRFPMQQNHTSILRGSRLISVHK